jgi:MoxR-like ATPase
VGWERLDPVLLAALASESPLLLVGSHGTAKTLVAERVAAALGLEFRHYNASLLSYDDLVGIPLPDEGGDGLRFVGTPASVWRAEFVLLDEISRCRPDVQNKLFPVVLERKVAGVPLPRLRHRWAAMNPPAGESDDLLAEGNGYLGAESLDAALADRFAFVVRVPGWADLTAAERCSLVLGADDSPTVDLPAMVRDCAEHLAGLEHSTRVRAAEYAVAVVDQLGAAGTPLSPRRAATLKRNVVAVHAARLTLGDAKAALEESAAVAVEASLPQSAEEPAPAPVTVRASHRQAWELSGLRGDDAWRSVLEEPDPLRRVRLADKLGIDDAELAKLVTQALGAVEDDRRVGRATALYLRFHDARDLTAAAWAPVVEHARRVLAPRKMEKRLRVGAELDGWRKLLGADGKLHRLEWRLALDGYADTWDEKGAATALQAFRRDLRSLGVRLEATA